MIRSLATALTLATAVTACLAQQPIGPNDTALTPAATIALVGGKLLTVTHGTIENGTVVLAGGKIVAVGPVASTAVPAGAQPSSTPKA